MKQAISSLRVWKPCIYKQSQIGSTFLCLTKCIDLYFIHFVAYDFVVQHLRRYAYGLWEDGNLNFHVQYSTLEFMVP